ncbi:MAG: PspC domain-containing protein [Bacteroidales bacterium]|nr:PspC domain-containing protein [Candidatus Scybalocola fimicaballi]
MSKQLRLSGNKMFTGTAAGLAEYFNIDATMMRVIIAVAALLTGGICVVAYLVIWLIMSSNK